MHSTEFIAWCTHALFSIEAPTKRNALNTSANAEKRYTIPPLPVCIFTCRPIKRQREKCKGIPTNRTCTHKKNPDVHCNAPVLGYNEKHNRTHFPILIFQIAIFICLSKFFRMPEKCLIIFAFRIYRGV